MADNADTLLRTGFHTLESLGDRRQRGASASVEFPVMTVRDEVSDEYDSYTLRVTGTAQFLVPADPQREKFQFQNNGPETVVVGKLSAVQTGQGFMVPSGGRFTGETTGAVYVASVNVGSTTVSLGSVWIERSAG